MKKKPLTRVPIEERQRRISEGLVLAHKAEKRKADSKIVADHGMRWASNILAEILSNHVGPCFPDAAETLRIAIQHLAESQRRLIREAKD